MTLRLNPIVHELAGALRFVGLRNRLRCPHCGSIGTWKPHGTLWDRARDDRRPVRRWLCKWCGYYVGPEGTLQAFPSEETGAWALPPDACPDDEWPDDWDRPPAEAIEYYYRRAVNPWKG